MFSAMSYLTAAYDEEEQALEKEIFVLNSLKIIEGFDDGSYHLNEALTRAQFAALALRLLGVYDTEGFTKGDFYDVSPEHWAVGCISAANGLNLMNGYADGSFLPDKNVTLNEAVKILLCALGYFAKAENSGGYPGGYFAIAAKTGLLDEIDAKGNEELLREQAVRLLYNALDIPVIESVYEANEKYRASGDTMKEIALLRLDLYQMRGILTGADETTLGGGKLNEGKVVINGTAYLSELTGLSKYIGLPVMFFLKDGDGLSEVVSIIPEKSKYEEVNILAEDILEIKGTTLKTENENGREEEITLSARLNILYNGSYAENYDLAAVKPMSGTIRFIDADKDGVFETAHVSSEKAFIIKAVEKEKKLVYFKDRLLFGKGFIRLDEEEDVCYEIYNANGEEAAFEDLKEGMDISVAASTDFSRIKVKILADNTFSGTLVLKNSEDEIVIDETAYLLAKEADGVFAIDNSDLKLGVHQTWHKDIDGKIFAADKGDLRKGKYAYVLGVEQKSDINKTLMLKLLTGGSYVEIEDETSTETELEDRMIKQLQNEGIFELEAAKKVYIDDLRYTAEEAAKVLKKGAVICYLTNDEGKINRIENAVLWGEDYITERTYIKKRNLFESQGGGAFVIDKNTAILNVPKEDEAYGIYMVDSDCYVKTTLKDSTEYTAQAYDYNEDTKTASAVLIRQDMSSEAAPEITTSTPLALVTAISEKLNEEGETVKVVSALRRGKAKQWECRDEVSLSNIRKGDIVRFTEDGLERIAKIEVLQRLEKALVPYHKDAGGINEFMYGYVQNVELDTFTKYSSTMVNVITLSLDGAGTGERTFTTKSRETQPPVYVWDLEKSVGRIGTLNNFRSVDMSDMQNANKALIYANSGEVQAIFIVN